MARALPVNDCARAESAGSLRVGNTIVPRFGYADDAAARSWRMGAAPSLAAALRLSAGQIDRLSAAADQ